MVPVDYADADASSQVKEDLESMLSYTVCQKCFDPIHMLSYYVYKTGQDFLDIQYTNLYRDKEKEKTRNFIETETLKTYIVTGQNTATGSVQGHGNRHTDIGGWTDAVARTKTGARIYTGASSS